MLILWRQGKAIGSHKLFDVWGPLSNVSTTGFLSHLLPRPHLPFWQKRHCVDHRWLRAEVHGSKAPGFAYFNIRSVRERLQEETEQRLELWQLFPLLMLSTVSSSYQATAYVTRLKSDVVNWEEEITSVIMEIHSISRSIRRGALLSALLKESVPITGCWAKTVHLVKNMSNTVGQAKNQGDVREVF